MAGLADTLRFVLTVARVADEHEIQYPAASLAYYPFVSLLPLLVLVLAVISNDLAVRIQTDLPPVLTPEVRQLMYESITTASGRVGAVLLAIAVLAWSAVNVVIGFQTVVKRVEGILYKPLFEELRDAVSILGSLSLAVLSMILTGLVFVTLPVTPLVVSGGLVVLFVTLTVAFVPMYYVPSRAVTSLSEAFPGAVTAALGWTVLLTAIHLYATNAERYAIYGVLSGIILVLTALYIAAIVLMVGIVVNAILVDEAKSERSLQW